LVGATPAAGGAAWSERAAEQHGHDGGLVLFGPARHEMGLCLGRGCSPWAGPARPAEISGQAKHGTVKARPERPKWTSIRLARRAPAGVVSLELY